MADSVIREFVANQRELLDLELQSEQEEERAVSSSSTQSTTKGSRNEQDQERSASHVLGNLEASDISVGLFGRTVVELTVWNNLTIKDNASSSSASSSSPGSALPPPPGSGNTSQKQEESSNKKNRQALIPAHRFTVGDEVEIRTKHSTGNRRGGGYPTGVISVVSDTSISVALFEGKNNFSNAKKQNDNPNNKSQKGAKSKKQQDGDDDTDQIEDSLGVPPLSLLPRSSVEVHKKLIRALHELNKHGVDHPIAGSIVQAMFHPTITTASTTQAPTKLQNQVSSSSTSPAITTTTSSTSNSKYVLPFNSSLDESQKEAIAFCLDQHRRQNPVALIHGPPGTGKTTTVAELIRQAVHVHGMKVLVTAPSNVAVDNILERLVVTPTTPAGKTKRSGGGKSSSSSLMPPLKVVRLGHPARIKSSILKYSLESLVQSSDGTEIVKDVRKELQYFLKIASSSKAKHQEKRTAYRELKGLRKEIRTREERVVQELIQQSHVVLATTVGASNRILNQICDTNSNFGRAGFDMVIIDEAAQALEASCWIPVFRGRRVVLAGDHCQLPPTIKSRHAQAQVGLSKTMFERVMDLYGTNAGDNQVSRMLKVQYRMHQDIANWASQAMYHGELSTHDSAKDRTLRQLLSSSSQDGSNCSLESHEENLDEGAILPLDKTTMLLVDTAGCDMHESVTAAGSRFNQGEAEIVKIHVEGLLELGTPQNQVAIITPYNGQVELIRNMLLGDYPQLEIRSVDGFQGGEREAVVLSLVRSSDPHQHNRGGGSGIGFLKDDRRQNVAVTRAKRHLAVICDSETVSQSKFIGNLLNWIEAHGEQRSAMEYVSEKEIQDDMRHAESELMKMALKSVHNTPTSKSPPYKPHTSPAKPQRSNQSSNPQKKDSAGKDDEELAALKRRALLDKISCFAETGDPGEEMALSSELTSYDRRLVHEFAEQNGLGHRSEGVEGANRRITLTILKTVPKSAQQSTSTHEPEAENTKAHEAHEEDQFGRPNRAAASFATLMDDGSDESGSDSETPEIPAAAQVPAPAANQILADLAKEREEREKARQSEVVKQTIQTTSNSSKSKKKKKKGGQKLGGAKKQQKPPPVDDGMDDLDDMAFLDAQINVAQNAHGRKVEGKGNNYRTIVNGILNAKPAAPPDNPKTAKASAALRGKLKQAQDGRKAKGGKKKK